MAHHAGTQGNIRAALVVQPVADDASMVIGSAQENAVAGIAVDVAIGHGEAGAAGRVGGVHSVLAAGQTEMVKRHVVSPGELDNLTAVRRIVTVHKRHAVARSLNDYAAVRGVEDHVADHLIRAGIDVDGVTGADRIGCQQGRQAGHGSVGALAALGVVTRCRGEHIAGRRGVIDVVVMPGIGDQERR